jgi:hypothetical protein
MVFFYFICMHVYAGNFDYCHAESRLLVTGVSYSVHCVGSSCVLFA